MISRVRDSDASLAFPRNIQWTSHAYARLLHHVHVDHLRGHILVPEQFMHRPNVIARLQ